MAKDKVAKGVAELLEELKKGPKIPGIEPVKVLKPRQFMKLDPHVEIFIPFAEKSDFKPADAYVDDVKKIAKPGIEKDYLLLASARKLSENYGAETVLDFGSYLNAGMTEEIAKDKAKSIKQLNENLNKHGKTLEKLVRNADNAWADPKTPAIVTPLYALLPYDDATNVLPDRQGSYSQNADGLWNFVAQNGSMRDQKNYREGKCFYVARYKEVKNDKGEKVITFDHVEIWQKKN